MTLPPWDSASSITLHIRLALATETATAQPYRSRMDARKKLAAYCDASTGGRSKRFRTHAEAAAKLGRPSDTLLTTSRPSFATRSRPGLQPRRTAASPQPINHGRVA